MRHTIVVPPATRRTSRTYQVVQNPLPAGLVAGFRFSEAPV